MHRIVQCLHIILRCLQHSVWSLEGSPVDTSSYYLNETIISALWMGISQIVIPLVVRNTA